MRKWSLPARLQLPRVLLDRAVAMRLYIIGGVGLCLLFVLLYYAGEGLADAQRQELWNRVAVGRDVASDVEGANAPSPPMDAMSLTEQAPESIDGVPSIRETSADVPTWVQPFRGAKLWREVTGEEAIAQVSQWEYLRVKTAELGRFQVEGGSGDAASVNGWIDIDDVGISGPPPSWVRANWDAPLFAGAESDDAVGALPAGADVVVTEQPTGARISVYVPSDPAARNSAYGWVEADAVVPSNRPEGVALPSPSFRAVPVGRSEIYRVRPGDSPVTIATRFGVPWEELVRRNDLAPAAPLVVGQVLRLPVAADTSQPASHKPDQVRDVAPGPIGAEYAVAVDGESGEILWAREANSAVAPASLTKIVTALVVLDQARLSDSVTVHVDSRRMPESTVMGLEPDEELTVEDLLYGLMLPSGNDAAVALAEHVAGSVEAFVALMNGKVRSLGLTSTRMVNPHGLDAPGHVTSAYDMAMLAREGMRNPVFRELAMARSHEIPRGKGYSLGNLNQLLWLFPGADGVKIGYTDAAGRAIVGSASQGGHRVFVTLMRSPNTYGDSAALLDWAFASFTWPE
ncbi:MAG: LysM peptidoglycan-binding domain-containing protein [Chloroflexi bacterium]|nr:LysM peptidoglycan-binding domain-containing protein [Chloroflexota bacterium]